MKRFLISLLATVGLLLPAASATAVSRYWTIDIYEPSATTNRTLNVEYKVFSTVPSDTFTVELFENSVSKGTQSVTHPNGNSGVFTITLPATGTYSYFVKATNHGDATAKNSKTVTVQVSNAPQPTVTTVTVNQAAPATAAGGGGGGAGAGAAGGAGGGAVAGAPGAAGQAGPGAAAGAATDPNANAGAVTDQAANTEANNNQDVLGAQAQESARRVRNNRNRNLAVVAVLAASAAGYIFYRRRGLTD